MPTSRQLLDDAESALREAGVASPRVDAELLLAHVTGQPRALVRGLGEVSAPHASAFQTLIGRRARREPLQHLTGTAPFRYLELAVGPGVFVPRPETELLVDAVLTHLADLRPGSPVDSEGSQPRPRVLVDLCSGSGALALALATEVPGSEVHAVEADPAAVAWARRNLERVTGVLEAAGSTLDLVQADATTVAEPGGALARLAGRAEVVVTNPPYIPDAAIPRDPEVRDHDPARALFGGPDGLDVIRLLVGQAARLLRTGGLLVIEHADVQGDDAGPAGVPGLLRADDSWVDVTDHPDLAGLPRFTSARRAENAGITPPSDRPAPDPSAFRRRVPARKRSDPGAAGAS